MTYAYVERLATRRGGVVEESIFKKSKVPASHAVYIQNIPPRRGPFDSCTVRGPARVRDPGSW